jgi:hypothetical protein
MTEVSEMPQTVRDYLAGRLSDADARAFEERFTHDPSIVSAMEDVLRLREGLATLRADGQLAHVLKAREHPLRQWVMFASAAALVAIAMFDGVQMFSGKPEVSSSVAGLKLAHAVPAVVARYSLAAMREVPAIPLLDLPLAGAIELRVLAPAAGPRTNYQVSLAALDGAGLPATVGSAGRLARDADGFVSIFVDAAQLKPGDYVVAVAPDPGDDADASHIPIRLRRSAASTRAGP